MSDLALLTDRQLALLLEDIERARRIAIRPVLRYRARRREIRAEMKRRVEQEYTKEK